MKAYQGSQALKYSGREEVENAALEGKLAELGEGGEGSRGEGAHVRLGADHTQTDSGVWDHREVGPFKSGVYTGEAAGEHVRPVHGAIRGREGLPSGQPGQEAGHHHGEGPRRHPQSLQSFHVSNLFHSGVTYVRSRRSSRID